jgi:hypothetical protein
VTIDVSLIVPIAMEEKLRFAIREGGRTVGSGVVVSITEYGFRDRKKGGGVCRSARAGQGFEIK